MTRRALSGEKAEDILRAARRVLGRKGYAGATINEVAREAGVSRGLLHYYFKSKEDMLARVIRETVEATARMAEDLFKQSRDARELTRNLVQAMQTFAESDPDFSSIFFESWGLTRQSERVDQDLRDLYHKFVEAVRSGLEDAARRWVIPFPADLQGSAMVITAILDGMSFQIMAMPELLERPGLWEAVEDAILRVLDAEV
jgi:AcrR family transcriptional regulator